MVKMCIFKHLFLNVEMLADLKIKLENSTRCHYFPLLKMLCYQIASESL